MKKILIIILLGLASCSLMTTKTPVATSILTNSDCNLPCWHGITIGRTTKQELLDILGSLAIVNQHSITVIKSADTLFDERVNFTMGEDATYFKLDNGGSVKQDYLWLGDVALLNDKVEQIVLTGDVGLSFQQGIDIFGEPNYLLPSYTPGMHIWVEALNPSKGLDFGYRADDLDSEITANTPIRQIKLFDAELYDQMVDNKMFQYLLSRSGDIERYAWKGYGKIRMYWHTE